MNENTDTMPEGGEYHWVLCYAVSTSNGLHMRDKNGLLAIRGKTRAEAYSTILEAVAHADGITRADFTVTFFALEPNRLGPAKATAVPEEETP